jgi:hypothetical protein
LKAVSSAIVAMHAAGSRLPGASETQQSDLEHFIRRSPQPALTRKGGRNRNPAAGPRSQSPPRCASRW